jgi:hypothetical protein
MGTDYLGSIPRKPGICPNRTGPSHHGVIELMIMAGMVA